MASLRFLTARQGQGEIRGHRDLSPCSRLQRWVSGLAQGSPVRNLLTEPGAVSSPPRAAAVDSSHLALALGGTHWVLRGGGGTY